MAFTSARSYVMARRAGVVLTVVGVGWAAFNALAFLGSGLSKTPDAAPGEIRDAIIGAVVGACGLALVRLARRPAPPST